MIRVTFLENQRGSANEWKSDKKTQVVNLVIINASCKLHGGTSFKNGKCDARL